MTTRCSFCWESARLESRRFRTNTGVMSDNRPGSGVPGKRDSWEFHVHLAAKRPMHRSAGRCSPEVPIWEAGRSSADLSPERPVRETSDVRAGHRPTDVTSAYRNLACSGPIHGNSEEVLFERQWEPSPSEDAYVSAYGGPPHTYFC